MANILDTLKERGLVKQTVFEDELYEKLGKESVTFYVGFDPTADSLHAGHFLALMAMGRIQRAGHRPIVLIGGGTAMVGDPTGRTDMRSMMTKETIANNVAKFKEQMSRFFSFEGENAAVMVNNADWLLDLNYIEFLRDIGVHFSVNHMLSAECFRSRMEKGLSFLEFNYMLMQGYDYYVLYKKYGCLLQCGGDDQWSNILAGADLIRKKEGVTAYAITFPLLTTSEGKKMGKTRKGALWLDANKTSPYEFFQYFRNVDDNDVENCLKYLTYVPVDEITRMCSCYTETVIDGRTVKAFDKEINKAKEVLAFEVTKIVHGEEEAQKALEMARGAFGDGSAMPEADMPFGIIKVVDMMVALNLAPSKGEAKRLIAGGGVTIDEQKVASIDADLTEEQLKNGFVIYKGKKVRLRVVPR